MARLRIKLAHEREQMKVKADTLRRKIAVEEHRAQIAQNKAKLEQLKKESVGSS